MKTCTTCGIAKPLGDYHKSAKRKDGVRNACKVCTNAQNLGAYHSGRSKASHKKAQTNYSLRKYGLTTEGYTQMFAQQGGSCAICACAIHPMGSPVGRMELAHVDHCHTTGKVRGLLCAYCNTSLGKMRDDPERLRRAAAYLEEHHDH